MDLKGRATLFNKLKQKPTFLWLAPYLGLNIEYMLDVLALVGVVLSFAGYILKMIRLWGFPVLTEIKCNLYKNTYYS